MDGINKSTSELMNYELRSSNSNNYSSYATSSSPESFPIVMENGIIVEYKTLEYSSKVIEEKTLIDDKTPHNKM